MGKKSRNRVAKAKDAARNAMRPSNPLRSSIKHLDTTPSPLARVRVILTQDICTNCGGSAHLACSSCSDAPILAGDPLIASYCSISCQEADLEEHISICNILKARRLTYRVAVMAQKLFYFMRELTWCQIDILSVERQEKRMLLRGNWKEAASFPADYKPFPSHLFPAIAEREAALSFLGCPSAVFWMVEFIAELLGGITIGVEEVHHKTTGGKRHMQLVDPEETSEDILHQGTRHELLRVTLVSGEVFALDIAGAQYGHHSPVLPWDEYENTRVYTHNYPLLALLNPTQIGLAPPSIDILSLKDYSKTGVSRYVRLVHNSKIPNRTGFDDILRAINLHLLDWQDQEMGFTELFDLPEEKFVEKLDDCVDFVHWKFDEFGRSPPVVSYFTNRGRFLAREIRGSRWGPGKTSARQQKATVSLLLGVLFIVLGLVVIYGLLNVCFWILSKVI